MKIFPYLIFFLYFNQLSAQLLGNSDYSNFAEKLTKIRQYNFKDKKNNCTQKLIYLGKVNSIDKHSYKVLTSHKNLSGKGVNDLIFVSEKNIEYVYRLNLPSDFPKFISNNKLFFKNNKNENVSMNIDVLKEEFCTPIECFPKI